MSTFDWIIVSLFSAIGVVATKQLLKLWTERSKAWERPQAWWFWSDALWRGWVRAMPVGLVGGWLMVAAFVALNLGVPHLDSASKVDGLAYVLPGLILAALCVMCVLLTVSAALFNRPKWIVAPHLRHEPGALEEWRSQRRERRRVVGQSRD